MFHQNRPDCFGPELLIQRVGIFLYAARLFTRVGVLVGDYITWVRVTFGWLSPGVASLVFRHFLWNLRHLQFMPNYSSQLIKKLGDHHLSSLPSFQGNSRADSRPRHILLGVCKFLLDYSLWWDYLGDNHKALWTSQKCQSLIYFVAHLWEGEYTTDSHWNSLIRIDS